MQPRKAGDIRATHLYPALGLSLNILDLVPALTNHILDLVGRQLQLHVRFFFAVSVWCQQLIKLRYGRFLAILQWANRKNKGW